MVKNEILTKDKLFYIPTLDLSPYKMGNFFQIPFLNKLKFLKKWNFKQFSNFYFV
jgi:hypothetical protein